MRSLRRSRRQFAAGLLVVGLPALIVAVSGAPGIGSEPASVPERLLHNGFGAVVSAEVAAVGGLVGLWGAATGPDSSERVEELRARVRSLREENARLIGVLQENMRLRRLLGFREDRPEYGLAAAEIVGRDTTPSFRVVSVEIRSEASIEAGMAVVASGGVVGRVHRVYGARAEVVIAADPRSRIDVVSQRNRSHGVVRGLGHRHDYRAELAYLRDRDRVREGDLLVTTGMGGIFPSNLPVGRVVSAGGEEGESNQRVRVEPSVDFSRLREVFVVTGTES